MLDVALRLEKLLLKQPGVEVVLTRRTNAYVPLEERTAIANRSGADLFLSIHANASADAPARGVETYFLNFAPNPEAEAIAARENAGSRADHAAPARHRPGDRAQQQDRRVARLRHASSRRRCIERAAQGEQQTLKNLGVKQAPFMVLVGATMPSVLAEISFMTNAAGGDAAEDRERTASRSPRRCSPAS